MTTKAIQLRRGSSAEHLSFTGLAGEITYDLTKKTLVAHDGGSAGGKAMAREDLANVPAATIAAKGFLRDDLSNATLAAFVEKGLARATLAALAPEGEARFAAKCPLPKNIAEAGQVLALSSAENDALYLPSGGMWAVLSQRSVEAGSRALYDFAADAATSELVLAGGAKIRNARIGHVQQAVVMRVL
ncbi:MAG: hypothetical protein LBL52_01430 [Rickettsiales bacterium]|jgi:hypothetical protein|nr:hypothetical protein [Rickettsiales bacterium]